MTSETETGAAEKSQANGKTDAKPRPGKVDPPEPKAEPVNITVVDSKPADEECEDCGGEPGRAAAGLGLLICAVAGGLLYIGLDLVTGGALSRKLGRVPEEDED